MCILEDKSFKHQKWKHCTWGNAAGQWFTGLRGPDVPPERGA